MSVYFDNHNITGIKFDQNSIVSGYFDGNLVFGGSAPPTGSVQIFKSYASSTTGFKNCTHYWDYSSTAFSTISTAEIASIKIQNATPINKAGAAIEIHVTTSFTMAAGKHLWLSGKIGDFDEDGEIETSAGCYVCDLCFNNGSVDVHTHEGIHTSGSKLSYSIPFNTNKFVLFFQKSGTGSAAWNHAYISDITEIYYL